jgi:uncharacterized protein involved in exopolysaccharide biosynthesis
MPAEGLELVERPLTFSRWVAETIVRWRVIAVAMSLTLMIAVLAVILIPPVYRSRASFVANTSASSKLASGIASGGALSGLASQLGMASGSDPSESANFYFELIQSRELLTRLLLSRFPDPRSASPRDSATLVDILRIRHSDPARRLEMAIKRMSAAINGNYDIKTNLVWIEVDAQWPELSAAIANRTIDLVTAFNREQRVSRAKSKRLFLEGRVNLAREGLRSAEARHRSFYDQNRSWRTSPALIFEEKQLQRDVDQTADLYTMLQRQLETALLDEVNDAALITIVDSAVPPRKAQWPRYGILLISTLIAGSLLGAMFAGGAAILADWRARNAAAASAFGDSIGRVRREIGRVFRRAS